MRSSYMGLGLTPELKTAQDYVVQRRRAGASDRKIVNELMAGKGPCASTTGVISCDVRFAAEAVATAPRDGGAGPGIIKIAIVGLGVLYVLGKLRKR